MTRDISHMYNQTYFLQSWGTEWKGTTPARSISDVVALFTLLVKHFHTLDALLPIYDALKEKQCYEPVLLNDLAPTITQRLLPFYSQISIQGWGPGHLDSD